MKPPLFKYIKAENVEATLATLGEHGEDAKILAGGQSLVPMLNFRLAEPLCLMALEQMKIHMVGVKAELGIRGPQQGHYPKVVYNQPAYKDLNIRGDCPIAENIADQIGKGEYQE